MAGGKIDILVHPDTKGFPAKLESGLRGGIGTATKIGSAIGVALGGAATIKGIATLGVEFDKQMNTMSAVSQATAPQLAAVEAHARDLGKSADLTATSASDAAAAMVELTKGGFSVQESMDAAKGTLQLASAAQIDAAQAATIQSQALQAFGLDASYAATASDVLAGAANASSAEIDGIAQGLQQSGAVANQFGLTIEDNATALAMFANAGIQGSDAGTLLKSALLAVTDQGKPAQAAMEELGLSVYDTQGKFVGMESMFGQLAEASHNMTDEQYQAATAVLFGSDAMRMAGIAAGQGAQGWRDTYQQVTRAGQASEVAAAQAQGIPGILEAIENQAEDTGIAVYDAFSGLALEGGGRLVGLLESAGPKVEGAARGIASGIESALPTVERVVGVVSDGVEDISGSVRVLASVGGGAISGIAGVIAPAAEGALSLTENLNGSTGALAVAAGALAVGKWKDWGGAVSTGSGNLLAMGKRVGENAALQKSLAAAQGTTISNTKALSASLQSHVPWIGRAAEAYRTNGAELRTLAANQKRWAAETVVATGEVHTFEANAHRAGGAVNRMSGVLAGAGAASFSVFKDGAKGVVSALGGPWNLALAGAAMAIAGVTAEIDKTRRSTELLRELGESAEVMGDKLFGAMAKNDLTGELDALGAGLDDTISKYRELADTSPNIWGDLWAGIKDLGKAFHDGPSAQSLLEEQKAVAENAKLVTEALQDAGISSEEAAAAIGGSAVQYDALIAQLDLTTEGGRAAADMLAEQREEYLRLQELTGELAPGAAELAEAMATIGDEAASSEDRVSALNDALNNILGIDPSAEQALSNLHEEIDQITESATQAVDQTKGFGDSLFGADGALDMAVPNARALSDELWGMRDSLVQVAESGGDVYGAYEAQEAALDALADQYGISRDKVREYADAIGLAPEFVHTTVTVATAEALAGLEEVYGAIEKNQIKAGEPTKITVENIDDTKAQLEELGWTVEELQRNDDGSGAIKVTANTDEAIASVQELVDIVAAVASEKGITFHSDAPDKIREIQALGIEIEDLGDGEYNIKSNSKEEIDLMLELGLLVKDKKTGEVQINSNLDDVLRKGKELDARHGKVNEEIVRIRIQEWREYYSSGSPTSTGGTSVGQHYADGGRHGHSQLPAYAAGARHDGYRLPSSGPGTDRVDGFTAIDRYGAPIARLDKDEWVINGASSERYDRELAAINAGTFPKLPGYADGGRATPASLLRFAEGAAVNGQQASRSLEGAPYVFGGANWGDCSSAQGQLALFSVGRPATVGRYMATMDEDQKLSALGFRTGLGSGPRLAIGWLNGGPGGGHTSGTIDFGNGKTVNVEMGGARGNGQIGGGAAPASHPQYTHTRHMPLTGGAANSMRELESSIDSTSVDGYTTVGGGHVSWGEAQSFYDDALRFIKNSKVYDTGGILPRGGIAVNNGAPERILNPAQTDSFDRAIRTIPGAAAHMDRASAALERASKQFDGAISKFVKQAEGAQNRTVAFGSNFGGSFLGQTQIVIDAEQGLLDTRKAIAEENDQVVEREEALVEARKELREVEKDGGALSVSSRRKLEDAEENLNKARKDGKQDKIAAAEKRLNRAREDTDAELTKSKDKNAEQVKRAQEKVNKAEDALGEAREVTTDQTDRLLAAERTIAAARFQAASDLASQVGEAFSTAFSGVSEFFGVLAEQAAFMEETRQRLAAERIEREAAELQLQRSRLDAQIAEADIIRVRAHGAIAVADAEAHLIDVRDQAALKGRTGIDAMSEALDRARVDGIFAVEDVADSVIEKSAEVRAAQHAVDEARAQAALDELDATHAHRLAVLDLAQATLTQQKAVALVDVSTQLLQEQAKLLGGLSAQGAQRASSGWDGVAQAGGGLGKLLGGLAAGAAGFAAGGPVGALLAGGAGVVSGLFDILGGGRKAIKNKDEIKESWNGMSLVDKLVTGGGMLAGGAAAGLGAAGSAHYGADLAGIGAELGASIISQSAGYASGAIAMDSERLTSIAEERRQQIEYESAAEQARIDKARAEAEMDYLRESTALAADVEIAQLLGRIADASTVEQADALAEAAIIAAERRDQMLTIMDKQLDIAEKTQANKTKQVINLPILKGSDGPTRAEFESVIDTVNRVQDEVELRKEEVTGSQYLLTRTR